MDPKVWGKLLTHHRRGYGVDVEALRDQCPLRRSAGKGRKMGSHGYRRLRRWKLGFWLRIWCFQGIWVYMEEEVRRSSNMGPTRVEGAPGGVGTPPCLVLSSLIALRRLQVLWITFVPKITFPKVSFRLDSVWYSFSAKHWNRQKIAIWAGPPVNRLVPKII